MDKGKDDYVVVCKKKEDNKSVINELDEDIKHVQESGWVKSLKGLSEWRG